VVYRANALSSGRVPPPDGTGGAGAPRQRDVGSKAIRLGLVRTMVLDEY
jgi:hypothetical protein